MCMKEEWNRGWKEWSRPIKPGFFYCGCNPMRWRTLVFKLGGGIGLSEIAVTIVCKTWILLVQREYFLLQFLRMTMSMSRAFKNKKKEVVNLYYLSLSVPSLWVERTEGWECTHCTPPSHGPKRNKNKEGWDLNSKRL